MKKPTTSLFLDRRYEPADKKFPVRIRVTHDRKGYFFKTGKSFTTDEWKIMNGKKPGDFKDALTELDALEREMRKIINTIPRFSIDELRLRYENKDQFLIESGTLEQAFKEYETILMSREKIKTAYNYKNARISFENFKPKWFLTDITADFLKDYEFFMETKQKKSITTVSMYVRALRTIINRALEVDKFPAGKKYYPFGDEPKYQIPSPTEKKNPLATEDLNKLIHYKTDDEKKLFARDMWLLCFYCGGRNYVDLLKLKYQKVTAKEITFIREKTKKTRRNPKPLIVPKSKQINDILKKWAQKDTGPDTNVLNILNDNLDAKQVVDRRNDFGKDCNASLALISTDLKIKPAIKMQQSRHTALNELNRAGVSKSEIQKVAGHASEKTTIGYLESLETVVNTTVGILSRPRKLRAV